LRKAIGGITYAIFRTFEGEREFLLHAEGSELKEEVEPALDSLLDDLKKIPLVRVRGAATPGRQLTTAYAAAGIESNCLYTFYESSGDHELSQFSRR
jgi:hypothetical protein